MRWVMIKKTTYPDSYRKSLKLIWWLRNIAIVGQTITVVLTTTWLAIPLDTVPLWTIIAAITGCNLLTYIRLLRPADVTRNEVLLHLLLDIAALFTLLYFSGGASNPFTSLFILQVVIAAIVLPPLHTWCIAFLTIGLYTVLLFWKIEVPYFYHHHIDGYFNIHVQGMWASFVLLALLVSGFIVRISGIMRRQEQLLAEAERIGAIGTLATAAAHELGTPLATMFLLAKEFETDATTEEQRKRTGILRDQLTRCKAIVTRITAVAGVMRAESGRKMPLDNFLRETIQGWHKGNPAVVCDMRLQGTQPVPTIVAEYGFAQAIINLLNNAAEAATNQITIEANWSASSMQMSIHDDGSGIDIGLMEKLGTPGVSTRKQGMGLGIFLTRNVITRLGGTVNIANHPQGGVLASIQLPLNKLLI
jgi:two-component system sensor histidine kinase RegB